MVGFAEASKHPLSVSLEDATKGSLAAPLAMLLTLASRRSGGSRTFALTAARPVATEELMPGMVPQGGLAAGGRLGGGRCPVPLTGALVRLSERDAGLVEGGGLDDLGVGIVVDGTYPAAAEVLDLGSGRRRTLDLEGPTVLLGWLAAESVQPIRNLLETPSVPSDQASASDGASQASSFGLGLLRRRGVDGFTLPVILRMGFADICRDLDPHEHPAVRFHVSSRGVARAQLEAERATLRLVTSRTEGDRELREALEEAFPERELRRDRPDDLAGFSVLRVAFPLPDDLPGIRTLVGDLRRGLLDLLARFDPERHRTVDEMLTAFGPRDTLRLLDREGRGGPGGPAPEATPSPATVRRVH